MNNYINLTHKKMHKKDNIMGTRIRKIRENKGISQEAMALDLDITQSSYCRLENSDSRITVPKIKKISVILQTPIAYLFNEKPAEIINQNNNEKPQDYNIEKIINSDKEHITTLKNEIAFLKNLIKNQE